MYITKTEVSRGYTVEYPEFEGEGCAVVNGFYKHLAECTAEYFESLIREDRHSVCRGRFSVEDSGDTFTVTVTLTLRRCGKRCGERILTHRWKRWNGRDAVLERRDRIHAHP